MRKILILIMLMFLSTSFVSGFSMSPPTYRFEYYEDKGINEEIFFTLTSSSQEAIVLDISQRGELQYYITPELEQIILEPGESKRLNVKINIPKGLMEAGRKDSGINFAKSYVSEREKGILNFGLTYVGQLIFNFPFQGEFISISSLKPVFVNQGENTVVNWEVEARGENKTTFVNELLIFDSSEELIFSDVSERITLGRNEKYKGEFVIPSQNFLPGNYRVIMNSESADNSVNETSFLRIGEANIDLKSFEPTNFTIGEIVEFSFVIESLWNNKFSNVHGELKFGEVSTITRSIELDAFGEGKIDKQYINLKHLDEGIHRGVLTVFFDDESKKFDLELTAFKPNAESKNHSLILYLAVVLVLVALLLILLFNKTKK